MMQAQMPDISQADMDRVRGYLQAQAAKLSIPDLVAKVRADSLPLKDVAASLSAEQFHQPPGPDDWSAAEVYTHVLAMTESGAHAIESILDTGAPAPPIDDQLLHEERAGLSGPAGYWEAFSSRREQLYERVLRASGDEHLDVTITHPMFGALNWREWFLFMRVHDLDHLRQLQAIVAATG